MFVLESTKSLLTIIGVKVLPKKKLPSVLIHFRKPINITMVLSVILSFATLNISIAGFLIFEATHFTEYTEAGMFYMISCLDISFYVNCIWKRGAVLCFVDELERFIQTSGYICLEMRWVHAKHKMQLHENSSHSLFFFFSSNGFGFGNISFAHNFCVCLQDSTM